jgi:hypothetical protein
MATLGSLTVNIVARTAPFTKGITAATAGLSKLTTAVVASGIKLAKWGAIAGAAGAAAGVFFVKQQLDAVDALAKTSDKLGIATDRLIGLNLAAEEAGVSQEGLYKAMQLQAANASKAAHGAKEQAKAFDRLGLSSVALLQLKPEDSFLAVAEALNKVKTQSERIELAKAIFGRGGVELLPMIAMGRDGLLEADRAARALGLTITRDMAAAVERANDAFGRVLMLVTGVARQIAVRLSPIMEQVSKSLVAFFSQDGAVNKFADSIATALVRAIGLVIDTIHELRITFHKTLGAMYSELAQFSSTKAGDLLGLRSSYAQFSSAAINQSMTARDLAADSGAGARWAQEQVNAYKAFMKGLEASGRTIASPVGDAIANWFVTPQAVGLFGGIGAAMARVSNGRVFGTLVGAGIEQLPRQGRQVDQELTARLRGDIDTYAAARRSMRDPVKKAAEKTAKNTGVIANTIDDFLDWAKANTPKVLPL